MSLHVGGGQSVKLDEIVAIINLSTVKPKTSTEEFLQLLKANKRLINVSDGKPKSCIITKDFGYLSAISTTTLQKRMNELNALQAYGNVVV